MNNIDLELCRERLDILRQHCQDLGTDYDRILKTYSCDSIAVAPTHAEAERMLKASFFDHFQPMVGTPEEVAAQIQPYIDLGVRHFIFRWVDFPKTDGVELFMKEVMPLIHV